MEQTWRWFGPADAISLTKIRQAGATGVVTALHEVAVGEVWTRDAVQARKALIEGAGLRFSVVESLPIHGALRLREAGSERYVASYKASLESLGHAGVRTICYNFMPVIDWTRTSLATPNSDGSLALHFDAVEWAAFDLFLLERPGATEEYSPEEQEAAGRLLATYSPERRQALVNNIAAGLPGRNEGALSLSELREALERYQGVDAQTLRANLIEFLREVLPVAERYGQRLCLHPDDPPRPLLGLPRIASCQADFEVLFKALPSHSNAMTLCVGSLGAGAHNKPEEIAERLAPRVGFAHLRSVRKCADGSFTEAEHLFGDANLVAIVRTLLREERRRAMAGDEAWEIPMRPDHGHQLEGDIEGQPGYPWLGRLKALAELRGVIHTLEMVDRDGLLSSLDGR